MYNGRVENITYTRIEFTILSRLAILYNIIYI